MPTSTYTNFKAPSLILVPGCMVKHGDAAADRADLRGQVLGMSPCKLKAEVKWSTGHITIEPTDHLTCGFKENMLVFENPSSRTRSSRGVGRVLDIRVLGSREQVLVEFQSTHQRDWVPFEHLSYARSVEHEFSRMDTTTAPESAEIVRLKVLAIALDRWHENTGALSRLCIDPLPHQLHLVHHILADGNLNWLIADDVGLGKTIEVGMLLSAMRNRLRMSRFLIIVPAGLVEQWKEELIEKFNMDDVRIYGDDFRIRSPDDWKMYDRVIASIDRIKQPEHRELLALSPPWSAVVFDEAHRLTRRLYGRRFQMSMRYELAAMLRQKTDVLLLLSATPHQGDHDLFKALIELIRPEWGDLLYERDEIDPDLLVDCVFRNRKIDVTDAQGRFIFEGQTTHAVQVPARHQERDFDAELQNYARRGYAVADDGSRRGKSIGFVMTVFRKLAASSPAAILNALRRRLTKLQEMSKPRQPSKALSPEDLITDERFAGEAEEDAVDLLEGIFFTGEQLMLEQLIAHAEDLARDDIKLNVLTETIIPSVSAENEDEKVVIFTEYRSTQASIARALRRLFGTERVALINGSMSLQERRDATKQFNTGSAQFLVSTEAGSEGINLHRACHHLVNYDLPWNPMRLVQRIGRIYRYGQRRRVIIFNLHAPHTLDASIITRMYSRLEQIAQDLSQVSEEYRDRDVLTNEIFGELASTLDVQEILAAAWRQTTSRTTSEIEGALARATQARTLHADIFQSARRFDADELRDELQISFEHVASFARGMLQALQCEIAQDRDETWKVKLADPLRRKLGLRSHYIHVTTDREHATQKENVEMLDVSSPLFNLLLERGRAQEHACLFACAQDGPPNIEALITAILRWQNDQGQIMRQELLLVGIRRDDHQPVINTRELSAWLARPSQCAPYNDSTPEARKHALETAKRRADQRLAEVGTIHLHPAQAAILSAVWFVAPQAPPSLPAPSSP